MWTINPTREMSLIRVVCGVVKAHRRSGLSEWLSLRSHWSNCDRRQPKFDNHKLDRFNGETRNKMSYKKV